MGEFSAGKWILGLSIYFFVFFLIVLSIVNALLDMGETTTVYFNDPGFQTQGFQDSGNYSAHEFNGSTGGNIDYTKPGTSFSSIKATFAIMTGLSSHNVNLGMPTTYRFIMVFFLFWIPLTALLWSIYMALPFLH